MAYIEFEVVFYARVERQGVESDFSRGARRVGRVAVRAQRSRAVPQGMDAAREEETGSQGWPRTALSVVESEHDVVQVVLARRRSDELEDLTVLERLPLLDHDLSSAEHEDRVVAHRGLALDRLRLVRDLRRRSITRAPILPLSATPPPTARETRKRKIERRRCRRAATSAASPLFERIPSSAHRPRTSK